MSASPSTPVRGQTSNTLANLSERLPIEGFSPNAFTQDESTGSDWYHAMLVNFNQHFKGGSEVQVAYTWSRNLTDTAGESTGANGGQRLGNQNDPHADYGPDQFNRPQRFVANFVYEIPTPFRKSSLLGEAFGGWAASGVVTIQAGHFLYVTSTNGSNAFGINGEEQDFAEIAPGCSSSQLGAPGSVTGKLNQYFNKSCFSAAYPVITADGGTGFGNSRPGLLRGPAQNNVDLAARKTFTFDARKEPIQGEFRAEFFNAFNTPQFSDPNTYADSATFGFIGTTSVAPRVVQLAIKLSF